VTVTVTVRAGEHTLITDDIIEELETDWLNINDETFRDNELLSATAGELVTIDDIATIELLAVDINDDVTLSIVGEDDDNNVLKIEEEQ